MKSALLGLVLVGCAVGRPGAPALPDGFPADFPIPPGARLVAVTGPLPFLPAEIRGTTVEWTSSLSRPELETFYRAPHPGWIPSSRVASRR